MAINPSASSSVSIFASGSVLIPASVGSSVDDMGILPSPSESKFFDVFCLPRKADGKFVVKGASRHVERDPMIPSIPTKFPLVSSSKGGKVVLPLGSTKVFCDLDKAVHKFVTESSVSIAVLIVHENLIEASIWVLGSCDSYSDFPVPLVPSGFEASPKPKRSLKRKIGDGSLAATPSSFLGSVGGINTLAILNCSTKIEKLEKVDRVVKTKKISAKKVEKAAGKSKGVVPQGAPLVVMRSKRLKSASFKSASAGGFDKGVVEGCVIEVDNELF
ncbi:hypothetical protein SLEP1_g48572 [Rubroshorea leprosula]|uniref:Uncharacterized protein n=1 Tax=Rubroshorea leprosula TaxID=152421 RepID=A0AAV5LVZ6_9ROSI|nr:hypothetical protein SLEP1_g48572 [Rubroshorea leprosula]